MSKEYAAAIKIINDMEKKKRQAIAQERWLRAAEIDSYLDGFRQACLIFDMENANIYFGLNNDITVVKDE